MIALHLDQRVEHHRAAIFGIDLERVITGIIPAIRIVAIDLELARFASALCGVRGSGADLAILGQSEFGHVFIPLRLCTMP